MASWNDCPLDTGSYAMAIERSDPDQHPRAPIANWIQSGRDSQALGASRRHSAPFFVLLRFWYCLHRNRGSVILGFDMVEKFGSRFEYTGANLTTVKCFVLPTLGCLLLALGFGFAHLLAWYCFHFRRLFVSRRIPKKPEGSSLKGMLALNLLMSEWMSSVEVKRTLRYVVG